MENWSISTWRQFESICKAPDKRNKRNISQHCWEQHVAYIWPPCCEVLRHVVSCWLKFENGQIWDNNTQHVATRRNTPQQGGHTRATCCVQQCCDMLRWHVAIVWPGLNDGGHGNRLRYGVLKKHQAVSFSKVQVWLKNRWNFAKLMLHCGRSSRNCL